MIEFVYGQDKEVAEFVAQRIPGLARGFGPNVKTIGIVDARGVPLAGVVYHHWNPDTGTIGMSAAAQDARWLTRSVLQRIFDYPFHECDCQMVMMQVPADDEHLLRQLAVGGFAFIRVPRLFGRNRTGVIALLTDDDWRNCRFNRQVDLSQKEAA